MESLNQWCFIIIIFLIKHQSFYLSSKVKLNNYYIHVYNNCSIWSLFTSEKDNFLTYSTNKDYFAHRHRGRHFKNVPITEINKPQITGVPGMTFDQKSELVTFSWYKTNKKRFLKIINFMDYAIQYTLSSKNDSTQLLHERTKFLLALPIPCKS